MINMGEVWQRGAKLGLIWTLIFFGVTGLIFLLMGMLGWSGAMRALCAMAAGPFLATGAIVAWWMVRRPSLTIDKDKTLLSQHTVPLRGDKHGHR